jgi:replicative DNA helicase
MSDAPPIAPPPGIPPDERSDELPPLAPPPGGERSRNGSSNGASNGAAPAGSRGHDRVPPHSLESEVSVLGACLISNDAVTVALELLKPEDFYRNAHRVVFEAVQALATASEPVDAVTVTEWLSRHGRLDEVGGAAALYDLTDQVPTAANAAYYARIVRDRSLLRHLIEAGGKVTQLGYEPTDDALAAVDRAESIVYELSQTGGSSELEPLNKLLADTFANIEKLSMERSEVTGLATGFDDLDRITAGLQKQNLVIIAARPSMGKSGLALGIAEYVAIDTRKPVLLFSLEMSRTEIVNRMLSSQARIDSGRLRTGRLEDSHWRTLGEALGRMNDAPLYIDDTASITMLEIRAKARRLNQRMKDKGGLSLVIVDYLQLMSSGPGRRSDNRVQEVAEFSRGLKMLAKELDVPVIALSQLSRQPETRTDKRPMLSDLRESGSIEQDADIVGFIYRDEVYDNESPDKGTAELIIAKHRNGAVGKVQLAFLAHFAKFANLSRRPAAYAPAGGGAPAAASASYGGPDDGGWDGGGAHSPV